MLRELRSLWSLQRVPRMTPSGVADLQERKLREALRYAYERVPLHRKRFDEAGVRPADIRNVGDLPRLPQMTKQDLQTPDVRQILAAGIHPAACSTRLTTGSTGRPLRVYLTPADRRLRSFVEWRSMIGLGVRYNDFVVCVGPDARRPVRLHERLGFFATEYIRGSVAPEDQLRRMRDLHPSVLWTYPSTLRALLRAANYRLRDYVRPRMVVTSSEVLDDLLREQVREDLGVDPFNAYGANEIGRIATECPALQGMHINADHVVLESWVDGRPARPGETGAALVTTLNAAAMPLIRYRLGDCIRLLDKPCACGSPLPLMDKPGGRESDVIVLPSGRIIVTWTLSHLLREYLEIVQFRILQERQDYLRIELVTRDVWPEERLRQIHRRALERVGEAMEIEVRPVDEIPEDQAKFRFFISSLPPEMRALRR